MQTKKLLSLFTAVTMAVSAFSAFVFPASAEETPITTTLQHTAMFRVMSRDAENQATFELDGAETYANALEKNDWVSTALMQFSVDDENVDFTKVKSATLTFTGTNVNATKSSTLSVYSTGNADYDATTLDMNSLYTVPDTFGSGAGANVAINTEGALGGLSKIVDLPDLAAGHSGVITADITDYVKGLEAGTSNISLAVSNSNRGVTIVGKGGAVESQPTLNIVLSDEVAYSATIKTNAYAKITIGENNYYADGAGNLEIENLADGTSFDYTIAKSGYTTEQGSLTVSGADASVEKYLTPTDEKILYTEDFEDIGVAEKATLFNYQNNGGNGTAGLRYYNGGMEFLSTGNGERSGQFTFSPAIDASSGAYEINFELKNLYMSQNKSGTFTSEISFVDENDNVIFGVIPTFTDGQVSTGLNVKAGTDVKTVTTDNLADKTLTVKAVINNGTVTVNVDDYEAVTLSQAEGTQNIITGMKNVNARLIFATLDNIVIASNGVVEPIETPIPEKYAVTVAETTNGTVTADKTEAAAGETITLTVTPAENYELDTLSVTAADDTDVPVTNNEFVMPAQAVTVTAAFKAVTIAPTQAPTEAPTQAPTQAPTEAPTQAPTEAPTQAPTEAPTQAPTEAPTEEPIGENEAIRTLYEAPAEDTQAVVIISTYDDDGEMLSMSIDDITLSAGETRVRVDAPNGSKVMIWDSLASMTPLADPAIAGDGYVDPTPTTEPTAAPTQEPIDLTAVIDFTNRTLTYESKGNTTVFNVVSADTIAPALAAAGAGDVLQLGSNQNGASKMLGYKASFAKEGEDVVVYSGQATMSFKLELNQVRTDKDAKIELSFADINGTSILPITVGTGNSAYLTVNGVNASNIAYGNYYIVTYTMDFDAQTASVTITDASGNPCLDTGSVAIEAENITQLYRADSDWLYGYVIIDDIKLDATNIGVPKFYTITVNTERYAKLTTDAGDKYFADVNGKLEIPLQTPGTTFDYTISKVGYADVTGTVEPLTGDITIDKPMTKTDESVIFIESEFGNENEAYVSPGGNRNDSISLGEITLPDISEISVDFEFAGFGNYSGQQKTWYINTDAGELVGIQINDNGLIAWTGWTGSANHNQSEDAGTFTNSEKIGDAPNGAFTVSFVVDKVNKAITVLYNDSSYSLPYTIEAATITGLGTGLYRYNGELKTTEIKIVEPDTEFMQLSGDTSFAKVSGKTVTRSYLKSEAVITPGETFTWAVTNAEGATDANVTITQEGVLSVTDAAVPGVYTITCTGTTGKTASLDVTVQDFATVTPTVDGPKTYTVGQEGTYAVTSLVDQYGDDVFELFDAKFASDNTDVITIDETTGVATAVANGDANISITIGNPGKENTVKIPVTVDTYYNCRCFR